MFPAIVTAVPLFLMMRDVRLLNTRASLIIVYTAFNLPFVVWMMRGFFADLPRDLEEAALVDGDSRLGALVRVVLPLVAPGLAATAVFCLIVSWNEFLFALVLTQTDAAMTLPVGIAGRVTQYRDQVGRDERGGVGGDDADSGVCAGDAEVSRAWTVDGSGQRLDGNRVSERE